MAVLSPTPTTPLAAGIDDAVAVDDVWSWNAIRIELDDPRSWRRDAGAWRVVTDLEAAPAAVSHGVV